MSVIKKQTNDPDNYSKMLVPFESMDAANEALTKFFDEVGEIRKKYKIPDVLIITKGSIRHEDGSEGDFMNHSGFGSMLNQLPMAAYCYGQVQAEQKETISKLISGKV